jgi:hypothetical protein
VEEEGTAAAPTAHKRTKVVAKDEKAESLPAYITAKVS